ncbi:MAG TPA: SulP family inorganic anion transporter [Rhodanobacteraceae bacterium]|jgi:SulP family sulfate permease|nr:SulP family inorganic anion transporter [Rhodanobacteraceae bacterium]
MPGNAPTWHLYVPKLFTVLRRGYGPGDLRRDLIAGLTVAVVALPLSMALAIASGATPAAGLHTAIVAGFLISFFGGSRVQIGGPTAAFIPVVFNVIAQHGYDGMLLATLMASVMLILAGLFRLGALVRYMPQPVITGFTAGIAVSIFTSQVGDLLGLRIGQLPGTFLDRWSAYFTNIHTINPVAAVLALGTLALLIGLRRYRPRWPGFLIALVAATLVTVLFKLPVETILTQFGPIPRTLPAPHLPSFDFAQVRELLPSAFTIAFLGGVESLLSAVVSDGMIDGRHRSNCELVAQGIANGASALVGGLPATGAIVRTATGVRAGARSPVAGMAHALFILVFVVVAAPLANQVPLPAMGALLLIVAWNMSEIERIRQLLRSPWGDRLVLLVTFVLTVIVNLTVAIQVGVVLGAFLFMHRMSGMVAVESHASLVEAEVDDLQHPPEPDQRTPLPPGVEVYRVSGPLFFAVANRIDDVLRSFLRPPRVFILRLGKVPMIDATAATAIGNLVARCRRQGTALIFSSLQEQPARILRDMGVVPDGTSLRFVADFPEALALATESSATQAGKR